MINDTERDMLDVEDDDPNAPDEDAPSPVVPAAKSLDGEIDDAALAKALRVAKTASDATETPDDGETPPEVKPEAEPAVTDPPAKVDPPAIDIEAELEKRLQAKMAEAEQRYQQDKQRAIDAVTARHKKQEDTAVRKLRDLQAQTGMDVDALLETSRARQIEHLQVEQGLTEQAARELVAAREKAALYEAREAERQREFEEGIKTNEYRNQKLDFLSDAKQPDIYKKALQKYGDEVDAFSDQGKQVAFEVALKYTAGLHLPEIVAELSKEAEAKLIAKAAEVETARKVGEQTAIRNIQQRGKAAPETKSNGASPKDQMPREVSVLATRFGLDPQAVAKTRSTKQTKRN